MIDARGLVEMVAKNSNCEYVWTLEDAREKLQKVDVENSNVLLLFLGAGNIDELRSCISLID
jgi:UDP-N-acetylmuramate-alanine ligase